MIDLCPVGRAGTPDEVASVAALLMGTDGGFITGSDFLKDGGVHLELLVRRARTRTICILIRYEKSLRCVN